MARTIGEIVEAARCYVSDGERARWILEYLSDRKNPHITDVIAVTAAIYHVSPQELVGPSRRQRFIPPRHMAMAIGHLHLRRSMPDVGMRFGGRDHTTVLHACRKYRKEVCEAQAALESSMREERVA